VGRQVIGRAATDEYRAVTPEQMDALLVQAVAVARRGPTAKPNRLDKEIVANAVRRGKWEKP
jgi:hypothetical protein